MDTFTSVYCVNLARRADRWWAFQHGLPADWPFPAVERFSAIDGRQVKPPAWWRQGAGAWGCYRSHLTLIEQALSEGLESILLLEDDATFAQDFTARAREFLAAVPADWEMLYLGGQHLFPKQHPPRRINDRVFAPYNVNRTHAWALRGDGMKTVYQHLVGRDWDPQHHIDHHLGQLVQSGKIRVYCPSEWLIGQAAGQSNISGQDVGERYWPSAARESASAQPRKPCGSCERPIVVVLGQFRGGTSCVAGMLHHLGVSMGAHWPKIPGNRKGTFEAVQLARICRKAIKEPRMLRQRDREQVVADLRAWKRQRALATGQTLGAKHPTLCLLVQEILEAWPNARFVAVDRPLDESVASLLRVNHRWRWPAGEIRQILGGMIRARDEALASLSPDRVLRVQFPDIATDADRAAAVLAGFAGVTPTRPQLAALRDFVDPAMIGGGA